MSDLPSIDTRREPATTSYHGTEVTEDYRWLEDAGSEETRAWTRAQDTRTRAFLEGTEAYASLRERAAALLMTPSTSYHRPARGGDRFFALKLRPPSPQPFLVTSRDLADAGTETVLLDPVDLDPAGTTAIDWFVPSPDGRLVAVSLSAHGTEDGDVHVYDVAAGAPTGEVVARVNTGTAGGSLAWRGDSRGFWYTRHPAPEERGAEAVGFFQEVWFHELGGHADTTADADVPDLRGVFADDRIVENELVASADGRWVLDLAQKGDGGEYQVFARAQSGGRWWQVADVPDRCRGLAVAGDSLFLLSTRDAPQGSVLRLRLAEGATVATAEQVVAASRVTLERVAATSRRLWVLDMDGGVSGLRCFGHEGAPMAAPEVPPVSAVGSLAALGTDRVCYSVESFVTPARWWVHDDEAAGPAPTALDTDFPVDTSGFEVERVTATAADGTGLPVTLVFPPGRRGAPAPVVLTGYGGYGISLKPWFHPARLLWLQVGGVHAVANIRGGGEYGEEWHRAGQLAAKQTCFDDFAACARHLIDTGVTTREQLALVGRSNGGLLMGAMLTQHPRLARAVVAEVPVLDMLRVELHPNGAFNVTEFGTVQDPDLFAAMHAYSPVHRVRDGTAYPAVLLTAGEHDPRVDAYHAKKMAARLQAATSSSEPVLLLVQPGGHGMGASLDEQVENLAYVTAFVADRLGVQVPAPVQVPAQRAAGEGPVPDPTQRP